MPNLRQTQVDTTASALMTTLLRFTIWVRLPKDRITPNAPSTLCLHPTSQKRRFGKGALLAALQHNIYIAVT